MLTSLIDAIVGRLLRGQHREFGIGLYGSVWAGYLVGAVTGGIGYAHAGAVGLALPIVGLLAAGTYELLHPYELVGGSSQSLASPS